MGTCISTLMWANPCQRCKKKGQYQKVDFVDEMWKIKRQFNDFDYFLLNFCLFCWFLAQNEKYPQKNFFLKWKIKQYKFFYYPTTYFKHNIWNSDSMHFMTLVFCVVVCNVLCHFYRFSDFHVFNIVKNAFL